MSNPALNDSAIYRAITDYMQTSYAGELVEYAPNGTAPLFALTSLMNPVKPCFNIEHGFWSQSAVFPSMTLTAAVANGTDATFTVGSTQNVLKGDTYLVWASTKEIVRVNSVNSATSVTVTRSFGATTGVAIASGVKLYKISNAFEEASMRPAPRSTNPTRIMNYTQIIRNTWALPGTVAAMKPTIGGSQTAKNLKECKMWHAQDIEFNLIFGQKYIGTADSQSIHAMEGVVESVRRYAPGNVFAAGGTTSYTQLETMLNKCFDTIANGRNGNVRTAFVGGTARTVINNIGRASGQYQIIDGQTNFGLQFSSFKTSRGTFNMIEHPLLNSNADFAKMLLAIDIPSLTLCYLPGRQQLENNYNAIGQFTNGEDSVGGDILSEVTMENTNPYAHVIIENLTAAA
jgi:hypothetical protein